MASLVSEEPEIPKHLQCPITLSLMKDPVTASDGQTYEKEAIEKWMKNNNNSSPFTRKPITSINPNFAIKNLCEQFMLSNETLLTKELMEMEEKIKNKKEKMKKLREKREEEQKLRKLKEEEELKRMNPSYSDFVTMSIDGDVYRIINTTTTTTTTITSNSIPDENGNIDCTNCVGCKNCIGCVDCVDCHGCTGCTNCNGCIRCTGCVNCKYCGSCTGCKGCDHCQKCTGCALCKKCEDCINCHSCIMMKHVKNHRVYR